MPFGDYERGTATYDDEGTSSPDEKILGALGVATGIVMLVAMVVIALDNLLV